MREVIKIGYEYTSKGRNLSFSYVKDIHYFSDGCAGQYKNFLNLAYVNVILGKMQLVLFATSYEKFPCDTLGGTLKRLAARASLQRPLSN